MWEYATRDVRTVPASGALEDVIHLMTAGGFRHVPVVDELGQLVGMVSDRDVRRLMPSPGTSPRAVEDFVKRTSVRDIMTKSLVTLERDASMRDAVETFVRTRVGALPILDKGELVGILSQYDALRAYGDLLAASADESLDIEETAPSYDRPTLVLSKDRPLVFVVEPSDRLRRDLQIVLRSAGIDLTSFPGLDSLMDHRSMEAPDLILLNAEVDARSKPLEVLGQHFPVTPVVITREGIPPPGTRRGKGPLYLPCTPEQLIGRIRGEIGFCRWTHDMPALACLTPSRTLTLDIEVEAVPRVLIIDQDPLTRRVLRHHFGKMGCHVEEAADGHEALSRLALEVFDIVTLELNLPFRSGFELLEYVQRDPERAPQMVVVSTAVEDDEVVEAFARGALDFIRKPLVPDVLARRIQRLLRDG